MFICNVRYKYVLVWWYWGREFWWLGSIFRVLAPLPCSVPLSSVFRYNAVTLICQCWSVRQYARRQRGSNPFVNELPFQCSCSWIGPCPAPCFALLNCELFATLACAICGNYFGCIALRWGYFGCVMLKLRVWNCFAVGVCIRRREKGGAITEGGLDTPCLANTTTLQLWDQTFSTVTNLNNHKRRLHIRLVSKWFSSLSFNLLLFTMLQLL